MIVDIAQWCAARRGVEVLSADDPNAKTIGFCSSWAGSRDTAFGNDDPEIMWSVPLDSLKEARCGSAGDESIRLAKSSRGRVELSKELAGPDGLELAHRHLDACEECCVAFVLRS